MSKSRNCANAGALVICLFGLLSCNSGPAPERQAGSSQQRSPLVLEAASLAGRPELLAKLNADPFTYFRFTNKQWAQNFCERLLAEGLTWAPVHLHGDAHIGQYAFTSTERGLDDFDDSATGPAALDIVRFLSSIDLATRRRDWPESRDHLFEEFLRGYRMGLEDAAYMPPTPAFVTRMRSTKAVDKIEFLEWAESLMEPLSEQEQREFETGLGEFITHLGANQPDFPVATLKTKAVGWLRIGVGSALTPKQLVRFEGPTLAPEDDVIMESKELSDLDGISCIGVPAEREAIRVIRGVTRLGRVSHDFLAVVPSPDPATREWWVRTWEASYQELQLDDILSPEELAEVVHDVGAQLGQGHGPVADGPDRRNYVAERFEFLHVNEEFLRQSAIDLTDDFLLAWEIFRNQ